MKKCKECGDEFKQFNSIQKLCIKCAMTAGKATVKKEKRKEFDKETKRRKKALKSRNDWLKEAQSVFNKFIRLRDEHLPCISCCRFHNGQYHASHYRSVGACSSLRFNEDNVHKSCYVCNTQLSGNILEYRIELIKKIGIEKVEWLECQPKCRKWTIDEAKEIIKKYKELCKLLT